jgi:hypothetical protein
MPRIASSAIFNTSSCSSRVLAMSDREFPIVPTFDYASHGLLEPDRRPEIPGGVAQTVADVLDAGWPSGRTTRR